LQFRGAYRSFTNLKRSKIKINMTTKPRLLTVLDIVALLLLAAAIYMVFIFAPLERVMGPVQKVFYFHVAAGWVGMLSYLLAAVAGGVTW
jgi:heme exporter protein C